ncbi:sigma 54-interacting transcriptional regulator [Thermodesulfobacteriota bacterium]
MIVNEDDFFRQATMRICGHLDIEKAMSSCVRYLQSFMPADMMCLELYHDDLGTMHLIAEATVERGKKLDDLVPMPPEVKAFLEAALKKYEVSGWSTEVFINNRPEVGQNPVSIVMLEHVGWQGASHMVMYLIVDGTPVGTLVLLARGPDRYKEEHAHLLSLLREPFSIAMSNTLQHREVLKLKDMLADDNRYLQQELLRLSGEDIVGADFGLKGVMEMVRQVAPLDSPVLLLGETGVGKDVIANAIHYSSPRRDHPFIAVNSGAIPENLLDSELFGHEKGAFTGAITQKRGRFERAHKGTIFLDEIGELPPQAQIRMLRVLQQKEIERVGGTKPIHVDVRIIAATHRNLEEMVKDNLFREDLWFRLNVFPIMIPPLRTRQADIPALVHHFVHRKARELKLPGRPKLAPGAMDQLLAYYWPGNVRELENVVERALILNRSGPLQFAFHDQTEQEGIHTLSEISSGDEETLLLDEALRRHIQKVLKITDGKVHGPGGAAELMGINPSTLRNRMNKLGIPYGKGK